MYNRSGNSIFGGLAWKFAERISSQGISFVISIILARLLMPEEYGIIAMVQILITIANVFISSGFSTALIQKKNADDLDFSTTLYCSMSLSFALYIVVYAASPYLAVFYDIPELTNITRVYALVIIIYGYNSIQSAWVSRNMIFRKFFFATIIGTIISGVLGVYMAYNGFGVWALVYQSISNTLINTITLSLIIEWHPSLVFSWNRAKRLMSYGSKILGADLIGTIFNEIQQLLIGKLYSASDLALLNRGRQFPQLITSNIDNSITSVLFPAMSNHSDDVEKMKAFTKISVQTGSYIVFFFMTLLAVISEPLIKVLLTEKWIECIPYLQLVCFANMIGSISNANLQAIKASGNSGIVLKLEMYKKPIYILLIIIAALHSVYAVALTYPIYAVYSTLINMIPLKRILNYKISEQIMDVIPSALLSVTMFIICFCLKFYIVDTITLLLVQTILSIAIYLGLSILFNVSACNYCKEKVIRLIVK